VAYLAFSLLSFYALQHFLARREFTRRHAPLIKLCLVAVLVGLAFQHTSSKALPSAACGSGSNADRQDR